MNALSLNSFLSTSKASLPRNNIFMLTGVSYPSGGDVMNYDATFLSSSHYILLKLQLLSRKSFRVYLFFILFCLIIMVVLCPSPYCTCSSLRICCVHFPTFLFHLSLTCLCPLFTHSFEQLIL